jgi:hypothetical protein
MEKKRDKSLKKFVFVKLTMEWIIFGLVTLSLILGKLIQKIVPEEKKLRKKVVPYILLIISLSILIISILNNFDQWLVLSVIGGFIVGYFLKEDNWYLVLTTLSANIVIATLAVVYGIARGVNKWTELLAVLGFLLFFLPIPMTYLVSFGAAALFATNLAGTIKT